MSGSGLSLEQTTQSKSHRSELKCCEYTNGAEANGETMLTQSKGQYRSLSSQRCKLSLNGQDFWDA